jgi:hypothetical protein
MLSKPPAINAGGLLSEPQMVRILYVLGELYLLEQHLIRTKDGEDAVPKGICFETDNQKPAFTAGFV